MEPCPAGRQMQTSATLTTIHPPMSPDSSGELSPYDLLADIGDVCPGSPAEDGLDGSQQDFPPGQRWDSHTEIAEQAKHEAEIENRIAELRRDGFWTPRRLSKFPEAARPKVQWDYLCEEMQWLSADFAQERRWKRGVARKVVRMVVRHHEELKQKEERARREEQAKLRRIATSIAKEVRQFWSNVEKVVQFKQQSRLEEKRKKALDLQLDFIVGQTEKYSDLLSQSLSEAAPRSKTSSSCVGSSQGGSLRTSPTPSVCHKDADFLPSEEEEEEDDEETIEMEERQDGNDAEAHRLELELLKRESELPLAELLRSVPAEYLQEDEEDQLRNHMHEDPEDEDGEFTANEDEAEDEEETIEAEEELEGQQDHTEELCQLAKEGEMSLEDLLQKYSLIQAVEENGHQSGDSQPEEDNGPQSGDSQPEEDNGPQSGDSQPEEDNGPQSGDSQPEEDNGPQSGDSQPEEENDPQSGDSQVSEQEMSESSACESSDCESEGVELLLKQDEDDGSGIEPLQQDPPEPKKEITDIAATAESLQPKGYTLATTQVKTSVPFLLRGDLREYQHIGLEWLVTMYEKKLNGILADEMGLGKTIQTISLLAHLACDRGNWGPHLIIVPTSVILNWEMELKRWCPSFKILTYYGSQKERKLKRQGWTKANAFHVCITSYKLVLQDHQAFRRKNWRYLILDEAQNIKNFKSQRWQSLLNFNSQRRLLLTGTPLQNSLMELWSLMHFLMPHVFQSHREFKEWFSNPLTGMIEGSQEYNEGLVRRLHKVLRPFLLRRIKLDVEKQMPKKYEHVIYCRLSKRQRFLYDDFMAQAATRETLASGHFMSVINILMQLRKVCNHPNLFDPRPIHSPFITSAICYTVPSLVLSALQRHPLERVDVSLFDLINMEGRVSRYESDVFLPRHKPSRVLIQEIADSPEPPPRPRPLKMKVNRMLQPVVKPDPRSVVVVNSSRPVQRPQDVSPPSLPPAVTSPSAVSAAGATGATQSAAMPAAVAPPVVQSPPVPVTSAASGVGKLVVQHNSQATYGAAQRFILTPDMQARLPSGEVVSLGQLASLSGRPLQAPSVTKPLTLQLQGAKLTLSGAQVRPLSVGQARPMQGNVLHLVSSGGQHHLLSQPAQLALLQALAQQGATPTISATSQLLQNSAPTPIGVQTVSVQSLQHTLLNNASISSSAPAGQVSAPGVVKIVVRQATREVPSSPQRPPLAPPVRPLLRVMPGPQAELGNAREGSAPVVSPLLMVSSPALASRQPSPIAGPSGTEDSPAPPVSGVALRLLASGTSTVQLTNHHSSPPRHTQSPALPNSSPCPAPNCGPETGPCTVLYKAPHPEAAPADGLSVQNGNGVQRPEGPGNNALYVNLAPNPPSPPACSLPKLNPPTYNLSLVPTLLANSAPSTVSSYSPLPGRFLTSPVSLLALSPLPPSNSGSASVLYTHPSATTYPTLSTALPAASVAATLPLLAAPVSGQLAPFAAPLPVSSATTAASHFSAALPRPAVSVPEPALSDTCGLLAPDPASALEVSDSLPSLLLNAALKVPSAPPAKPPLLAVTCAPPSPVPPQAASPSTFISPLPPDAQALLPSSALEPVSSAIPSARIAAPQPSLAPAPLPFMPASTPIALPLLPASTAAPAPELSSGQLLEAAPVPVAHPLAPVPVAHPLVISVSAPVTSSAPAPLPAVLRPCLSSGAAAAPVALSDGTSRAPEQSLSLSMAGPPAVSVTLAAPVESGDDSRSSHSPAVPARPRRQLPPPPRSPFYVESLEERRRRQKAERLDRIFQLNERRCGLAPVYGTEVLGACTLHLSLRTNALSRAAFTPEQRLEQLGPLIERFIFAMPPVEAPQISLHTSHPPPSIVLQESVFRETLSRETAPRSRCLHRIVSNMRTQFPDLRLIQYDCGKLQTLDRLLRQLKSGGHRVLLFTQMTRMLDVLEQFLNYHGHIYLRLDGSTRVEQRQVLMERFNMDKRIFCFILSTRSGGVGVNLTGADTVIFYDSDWNPTMDAQAQDRCHRIGQTRDVHIYRLVSERTVEENILKKAQQKRMLGDMAIEGGNFTTAYFKQHTIRELFDMDDAPRKEADVRAASPDRSGAEDGPTTGQAQILEQALCGAEDEEDTLAASLVRAEQVADLAEFNENIPLEPEEEEQSRAEQEISALVEQLTPIERYAMYYLEASLEEVSREELKQAEEQVEAARKDLFLAKDEGGSVAEDKWDEEIRKSRKVRTPTPARAPERVGVRMSERLRGSRVPESAEAAEAVTIPAAAPPRDASPPPPPEELPVPEPEGSAPDTEASTAPGLPEPPPPAMAGVECVKPEEVAAAVCPMEAEDVSVASAEVLLGSPVRGSPEETLSPRTPRRKVTADGEILLAGASDSSPSAKVLRRLPGRLITVLQERVPTPRRQSKGKLQQPITDNGCPSTHATESVSPSHNLTEGGAQTGSPPPKRKRGRPPKPRPDMSTAVASPDRPVALPPGLPTSPVTAPTPGLPTSPVTAPPGLPTSPVTAPPGLPTSPVTAPPDLPVAPQDSSTCDLVPVSLGAQTPCSPSSSLRPNSESDNSSPVEKRKRGRPPKRREASAAVAALPAEASLSRTTDINCTPGTSRPSPGQPAVPCDPSNIPAASGEGTSSSGGDGPAPLPKRKRGRPPKSRAQPTVDSAPATRIERLESSPDRSPSPQITRTPRPREPSAQKAEPVDVRENNSSLTDSDDSSGDEERVVRTPLTRGARTRMQTSESPPSKNSGASSKAPRGRSPRPAATEKPSNKRRKPPSVSSPSPPSSSPHGSSGEGRKRHCPPAERVLRSSLTANPASNTRSARPNSHRGRKAKT